MGLKLSEIEKTKKLIDYICIVSLVFSCLSLYYFYRAINPYKIPAPYRLIYKQGEQQQTYALQPLRAPYLNQVILTEWASLAGVSLYTLDWNNYQAEVEANAELYFTKEAREEYYDQLKATHFIEDIASQRVLTTAITEGVPVILRQGILNGAYSWKVQFPMQVTFQSPGGTKFRHYLVTMLINRVPTWKKSDGLAITQLLVVPN